MGIRVSKRTGYFHFSQEGFFNMETNVTTDKDTTGADFVPATTGSVKIVVCDRGFVLIGRVTIKDNYVTISNCSCVRTWGTTSGLGQIAKNGPTTKTKLDEQPTTTVHELQVVMMIDCEESKWNLQFQ